MRSAVLGPGAVLHKCLAWCSKADGRPGDASATPLYNSKKGNHRRAAQKTTVSMVQLEVTIDRLTSPLNIYKKAAWEVSFLFVRDPFSCLALPLFPRCPFSRGQASSIKVLSFSRS